MVVVFLVFLLMLRTAAIENVVGFQKKANHMNLHLEVTIVVSIGNLHSTITNE